MRSASSMCARPQARCLPERTRDRRVTVCESGISERSCVEIDRNSRVEKLTHRGLESLVRVRVPPARVRGDEPVHLMYLLHPGRAKDS